MKFPFVMKTAVSVIGEGDKQWCEETVTLKEAVLYRSGTKGSDIALINTDDKDDIFSIIEVHRCMLEVPELRLSQKRTGRTEKSEL